MPHMAIGSKVQASPSIELVRCGILIGIASHNEDSTDQSKHFVQQNREQERGFWMCLVGHSMIYLHHRYISYHQYLELHCRITFHMI
jgi:hypothetical protein